MSRLSSTGTAALSIAERFGFRVYPCRPNGKAPLGRLVPHGLLDASNDSDTIRAWWRAAPTANVAITTGMPDGPDILDVDVKHGAPGMATFARLKDAGLLRGAFFVVRSASGGLHVGFAGTDRRCASIGQFGLDFKAAGGSAVTAPSYVVDPAGEFEGRYELLEMREPTGDTLDWPAIRDLLVPPRPRPIRPVREERGDRRDFTGLVRFLEGRGPGDRNVPLLWAASKAAADNAPESVFDDMYDAIVQAGHDPRDAARTIASARGRIGATS